MSASAALQIALTDALAANATVAGYLGGRIYDNAPAGARYPYLSLGPAQELDDSAECLSGADCVQQIDIWTQEGGSQLLAKRICGAIKGALDGADLDLAAPYALASVAVENWRVIGDPDDRIAHGIVTLRALVEWSGT